MIFRRYHKGGSLCVDCDGWVSVGMHSLTSQEAPPLFTTQRFKNVAVLGADRLCLVTDWLRSAVALVQDEPGTVIVQLG